MNWLADFQNALHWGNSLRLDLFKSRHLGYLILLALMVTLSVGLVLFIIDPNVTSPMDGIWSAWVTMTHVGFGDVVPISFFGRLLSACLILLGLVLFSLFTALVSVALIGRNLHALSENRQWQQNSDAIIVSSGEQLILDELAKLHQRIAELEAGQANKPVE